jgi:hypothetical protein
MADTDEVFDGLCNDDELARAGWRCGLDRNSANVNDDTVGDA